MSTSTRICTIIAGLLISVTAQAQQRQSSSTPRATRAVWTERESVTESTAMSKSAGSRTVTLSQAKLTAAGDYLDVSFTLERESAISLEMVAATGGLPYRLIEGKRYPAGEQSERIDVGGMLPGTYILRVSTRNGVSQQRITITR